MKSFAPFLALAAGVTATFDRAPPFTCPGNSDDKCTDKQSSGFDFGDLDLGSFSLYNDFNFFGWSCEQGVEVKGRFGARTGKKVIGGSCSSQKKQSPSFGCGSKVDKFSLGTILVIPEFDTDLEFHYDMPDGSTCKHRNHCKKSGTHVVNSQCGGAKNVTIVHPPQPNKPKDTCNVQVPTISFECHTSTSSKPPKTTKTAGTTTSAVPATSTAQVTTSAGSSASGTSTAPAQQTTSTLVAPLPSTSTLGAPVPSSSTLGAPVPSSSTLGAPVPSTSTLGAPVPSSSTLGAPVPSTSTLGAPVPSSSTLGAPVPSTSAVTKTIVTSFQSTSTVFTTSTLTVTQCPSAVPNCPVGSVTTTVVTIAVSTTICPVTETRTVVQSSAVQNPPVPTSATAVKSPSPVVSGSSSSSIVTSVVPVQTLPCPNVVPSCLNTFMFSVNCKDNTDRECYCQEATFVKNIYDCLFAHGENDQIIADAVSYFQGLCANWVGQNPGIATGATVTTYITANLTTTLAPVYTTVVVDITTVVPCTNGAGEPITNSSTTAVIHTNMTVPQVDFTTGPAGGVNVIPVTTPPATTTSNSPGSGPGSGPAATTTIKAPTGTGSLRPTSTPVQLAAGGRVGASLGLAGAVALVVALAL